MEFERVYSSAPWEEEVGYCRAIRAGSHIYVTGTAPVAEQGGVYAPGDARRQAARCLELIEQALAKLGAAREHIVRTRMFVTDIARWREYGEAHRLGAAPLAGPPWMPCRAARFVAIGGSFRQTVVHRTARIPRRNGKGRARWRPTSRPGPDSGGAIPGRT